MKSTTKLIFILLFIFTTKASFGSNFLVDNYKEVILLPQDKTVLIKKVKAKIAFLEKQREKFKEAKKWSPAKEKAYIKKVEKLKDGLKRLGYNEANKLTIPQKIKKLQKELKYINNTRVNKNAKNAWTKRDDSIYEKKASKLIDSIIKLRMVKE